MQASGCSEEATSDTLHARSELADAHVEDVNEKMAKSSLTEQPVPATVLASAKPDGASGTVPSPAA